MTTISASRSEKVPNRFALPDWLRKFLREFHVALLRALSVPVV
jgi:hypothetical protein